MQKYNINQPLSLSVSVSRSLCHVSSRFPRHPLFPLLALLFEKCEQATQGSECITSASFDVDIENFVHQQEQVHKPFFSEDPELDNLVRLRRPQPLVLYRNIYNYA